MSYNNDAPQLGATFYPGSDDYYYPPDVVSPSPQRPFADATDKMSKLQVQSDSRADISSASSSSTQRRESAPVRSSSSFNDTTSPTAYPKDIAPAGSIPNFSPFPKLRNRPPNVPPSSDETEDVLEQARVSVLRSNDPESQLIWAQDTLNWVDISQNYEARIAQSGTARPQTPKIEHKLRTDAVNIVNFLADQQHPKADFMRGTWLEFGKFGTRMDKREAFRAYSRAASRGYSRAEYRMGMQFENSNEFDKAVELYQKGAAKGDSASNYRLGMMTLLGQNGQKQDFARGVHLIRLSAKSADENAPQGAYVYGMMLARELNGITIPELFLPTDFSAARQNIEKAAYLGFSKAQVRMGAAYEHAQLGCEFNPELSLHYNALASRQSEPEAEMAISKWFLCGHDGSFKKNEELAFVYAQRAAKDAYPNAEFAMGYMLEIGLGTKQDLKKAQEWYSIAAEHGNKDAVARVDGLKRSKTLSRKDHENVAIGRIISQRGGRNRTHKSQDLTQNSSSLPKLSETEPSPITPAQGRSSFDGYQAIPPVRPATVAPYPTGENSRPSSSFINPAIHADPRARPTSIADFTPSHNRLEPASSFINPNIRPSSAIDYNSGRPQPPSSFQAPPSGTTYQSGDGYQDYGRQPIGQYGQYPPQGSVSSGQGFQGSRPQDGRMSLPSQSGGSYSYQEEQKQGKLQKPPPQTPYAGQGGYASQAQSQQPSTARPYNQPTPGAYPTPTPLQHPQNVPPKPPKQPQVPSAPPAGGRPGRIGGPQTFEEIGVPPAKKEDDCVVM